MELMAPEAGKRLPGHGIDRSRAERMGTVVLGMALLTEFRSLYPEVFTIIAPMRIMAPIALEIRVSDEMGLFILGFALEMTTRAKLAGRLPQQGIIFRSMGEMTGHAGRGLVHDMVKGLFRVIADTLMALVAKAFEIVFQFRGEHVFLGGMAIVALALLEGLMLLGHQQAFPIRGMRIVAVDAIHLRREISAMDFGDFRIQLMAFPTQVWNGILEDMLVPGSMRFMAGITFLPHRIVNEFFLEPFRGLLVATRAQLGFPGGQDFLIIGGMRIMARHAFAVLEGLVDIGGVQLVLHLLMAGDAKFLRIEVQ